jgi:hypothetical protein
MPQGSYLTWCNFVDSICVPGEQRVHRISSAPLIDVFWDGTEGRSGLWVETEPDTILPTDLSQLSAIRIALVVRGGKRFVEVSSATRSLQRQFFHFAMSVAGSVLTDRWTAVEAIAVELQQFDDLMHCRTGLSFERQIGLFGELLFLERMIGVHGITAVEGWVGPLGEPHDFRIGTREYEVKTTSSSRRVHTINGESQLLPSPGRSLFIVSVLLGPGGGSGDSLAAAAQRIQAAVAHSPQYSARFRDSLRACGYREEDAIHFNRLFILRRALAVVPVNDPLPRLTRPRIAEATGPDSHRIEHVSYDLNVEGLEYEDGSDQFRSAILFGAGDI